MRVLRDRLVFGLEDGGASLRANGTPVAAVVSRLTELSAPARWIAESGLAPADLIAALALAALGDDQAPGPSLVQARPGTPKLFSVLSEPAWVAVYPGAPHRARLCLAAGLLQIHDFWDASHDAAQKADDQGERACSAYWHGIAHRREPDASNAAYWFRRVGRHPVFAPLAEAARPLFAAEGLPALGEKLIGSSGWNASAMTDLCTGAQAGTPRARLARRCCGGFSAWRCGSCSRQASASFEC
jgi:hypothetical protein